MAISKDVFYAIEHNSPAFINMFSKSDIYFFPYRLSQPVKKYIVCFNPKNISDVLKLLNLKEEDISGYEPTDKEEITLVKFSKKYEFSLSLTGSSSLIDKRTRDILNELFSKFLRSSNFDFDLEIEGISLVSDLSYSQIYETNGKHKVLLLSVLPESNNTEYKTIGYDYDGEIFEMDSIIPNNENYSMAIEDNEFLYAYIHKSKVCLPVSFDTISLYKDMENWEKKSLENYIFECMTKIENLLINNSSIIDELSRKEKENVFIGFIKRILENRVKSQRDRLTAVRNNIQSAMINLSKLVDEEVSLSLIVSSLDNDGTYAKIMKEIDEVSNSPDVKNVAFEEDGIIITFKHIMFPSLEDGNEYIHCGECSMLLPFDLNKEIFILKVVRDDYPELMKKKMNNIKEVHPNVFSSGKPCYGNIAETVAILRGQYDIASLVIMMNGFLHTYNPKDAVIHSSMFYSTTKKEAEELYTSLYKNEDKTTSKLISLLEENE